MSFLTLSNLQKTYADGTRAVRGIDLAVDEGEFVVLLGPSGCGKTTTLRMIAGLEIASDGTIVMGGEDVTTRRPSQRDVGFVFQFYALYPHLSVEQNIAFPLEAIGTPHARRRQRVSDLARRLGLEDLLKLHPRQLSGGDQQRVALARAMIRQPRVWLMDEPLGTLDGNRRLEMREFIRAQQLAMKVTTIYVTHDQEEAMSLADRVVVMDAGEIRQCGAPADVYDMPADLFVAHFVGSPGMNFIKDDGGTIGVRSEHVRIDPSGAVAGTVVLDEYAGAARFAHVETPSGRIVVRTPPREQWKVGQSVRLTFDPQHVNRFDAATGRRLP